MRLLRRRFVFDCLPEEQSPFQVFIILKWSLDCHQSTNYLGFIVVILWSNTSIFKKLY